MKINKRIKINMVVPRKMSAKRSMRKYPLKKYLRSSVCSAKAAEETRARTGAFGRGASVGFGFGHGGD